MMDHPYNNASDARVIAFYLPQFHPIPENDEWWGKGFTEWRNVVRGRPFFDGHYQPHIPGELGFYDLRLESSRHEQVKLAKQFGIDGFCFHYYWFSGKSLLRAPVDAFFQDKTIEMNYCLCWANESWSRRWDGSEQEILIAQHYSPKDYLKFIEDLAPYLRDPRYLRVNGAPIVIVYRPQEIPDPKGAVQIWRDYCRQNGIGELHLCAALTFGNTEFKNFDFDSGVQFPPLSFLSVEQVKNIKVDRPFFGRLFNYADLAEFYLTHKYTDTAVYKTVFPSWDNTARSDSRATIVLDGTPSNYEAWLTKAIQATVRDRVGDEQLVFVNAWNEWAEGCHLEPDLLYGRKFLEATLQARQNIANLDFSKTMQTHVSYNRTLLKDLISVLSYHLRPQLRRLKRKILNIK